jgi:hypothetical protein
LRDRAKRWPFLLQAANAYRTQWRSGLILVLFQRAPQDSQFWPREAT